MSPNLATPLDFVEHGFKRFREIEIGWDRLGSVGFLAPFLAPGLFDSLSAPTTAGVAQKGSAMPGTRAPARYGKQYYCLTAECRREGTWHRGA